MCWVTAKASGGTPRPCKHRKTWDQRKCGHERRKERSLFLPAHLSSTLFTSSPFPPSLPSSRSGFWSICDPDVHRRRPTSCVWASSFPSLLAVHVPVWEHYGLYISTQSRPRVLGWSQPSLRALPFTFPQNGPPMWQNFRELTRPWKRTQTGCRTKSFITITHQNIKFGTEVQKLFPIKPASWTWKAESRSIKRYVVYANTFKPLKTQVDNSHQLLISSWW